MTSKLVWLELTGGGPHDGTQCIVRESLRRLALSIDPEARQDRHDPRRAVYVRRGDVLVYAGVARYGCGWEVER